MRSRSALSAGRVAAFAGGTLLLAATWYALFRWLMGVTELLLVPWDTTPQRPPVGSWAHTVNRFFENAPGAYLPASVVVAASVALFALGLARRRGGRAWLPAIQAVANVAFMVLDLAGVLLSWWLVGRSLPPPQTGYDLGYHRTGPGLLVTAVLIGLLLWCQWRAAGAHGHRSLGRSRVVC